MKIFPLHAIDFYKVGHPFQYPKGTEMLYTNFTPRGFHHANVDKEDFDGKLVFFGLQGVIKWFLIDLWNENFFQRPLHEVLTKYKRRMDNSLGKDSVTLDHIQKLWELGYLPIEISALPEGTKVPMRVPVYTLKSTHKDLAWVVTYLETALSSETWTTSTEATISHQYRKLFDKYQKETGAQDWFTAYQGHDFSARGMRGIYDAAQNGAGHLVSFNGTDTVSAVDYVEEYYGPVEMSFNSVPASEHSCASLNILDLERSLGSKKEAEKEFLRRYITEVYPTGIASYVSDTYDFFKVITEIASELKDVITSREGKLTFRPDSGDPVKIICGEEIINYSDLDSLKRAEKFAEEYISDSIQVNTPHGELGKNEAEEIFRYGEAYYKIKVEISWNRHDKQYYYVDGSDVISCEEITLTPEQKGAVTCLWETFGGTTTKEGYKELDSHIGLIYGDSITYDRAKEILRRLETKGFSSGNVVFGIGSYTKVYATRDSFGFAYKATAAKVNGELIEIYKDPKTDSGTKKSAKGFLKVVRNEKGDLTLIDQVTEDESYEGEMRVVFRDGKMLVEDSFDVVRNRLSNEK